MVFPVGRLMQLVGQRAEAEAMAAAAARQFPEDEKVLAAVAKLLPGGQAPGRDARTEPS